MRETAKDSVRGSRQRERGGERQREGE